MGHGADGRALEEVQGGKRVCRWVREEEARRNENDWRGDDKSDKKVPACRIWIFIGEVLSKSRCSAAGLQLVLDSKAIGNNQKIAGQAFKIHKQLGTYGKYLIPLHAAGAVQHAARGHTIFARINPFRSPKH